MLLNHPWQSQDQQGRPGDNSILDVREAADSNCVNDGEDRNERETIILGRVRRDLGLRCEYDNVGEEREYTWPFKARVTGGSHTAVVVFHTYDVRRIVLAYPH